MLLRCRTPSKLSLMFPAPCSKSHWFVDLLIIGDAAVYDGLLAGVDNDEGQVDHRVGGWLSVGLLFCLTVALYQVLEGNLL